MKCKVCKGELLSIGSLPFDHNVHGIPIQITTPIEYYQCRGCGLVCAPEMMAWSPEIMAARVYNQDYWKYDPEYGGKRAERNLVGLIKVFGENFKRRHLDYGSGEGHLSRLLNMSGWDSTSYDPFSSKQAPEGTFMLVTAFEVFEHSCDLDATIKDIKKYLHKDGVVLFSTLLTEPRTKIDWWYIAPRGGHVNMQSKKSLEILAERNGLKFKTIEGKLAHIMQRTKTNIERL